MSSCKKVALYTLGCKVNQYETESIKNQMIRSGFEIVDFEEKADYYIVNTCTVTNIADRKSRNMLRRAKRANKDGIVIVTGCYAQTNSEDLSKMDEIDYIIGNTDKKNIINFIQDIEETELFSESKNNKNKIKLNNVFLYKDYDEYGIADFREMCRVYIKIQDGCNNFCSYCKIPFARGKSRSRNKENILEEVKKIGEEGFKEIIIIGINLGTYGEDITGKEEFNNIMREILDKKCIERVRVGSFYPDKITDEFAELFSDKNLMPHLHISLQSCDDKILKKMKRKYDSSLIEEKLVKLREKVPLMEFTGDIIVGFPGETDEMFQNTYNLIEKIGFSGLHIFPYSDRENTEAANFIEKVPGKIKRERVTLLEQLRDKMGYQIRKKYIGTELNVLIDEEDSEYYYGYSENYLRVKLKKTNKISQTKILNKIKKLKINLAEKEMLMSNG
ncbi:MAG: tRNA (N(6)-L-threonylcarbamoyladenosine(37)-C(2))-methylthiotransferase MtaB [Fusobacteriaceae bacterium]|jgi:threonylcarbamoyladenosine tRNA methylthiotransferase MtaB|nr:tRNA (N(6)-L-threonylcarbamoyladenosine(37)-C(2))-methylthiotransferase MtaB [Fusobacteriaceae bacterium]